MTDRDSHDDEELLALWGRLVGLALHHGVPGADAEDLASRAIVAALEAFDPGRGSFRALCRTALGNLVKNHWRDRKQTVGIDDVPGLRHGDEPDAFVEEAERMERLTNLTAELAAALDPDERRFFDLLGAVLEERDDIVVSEAARRAGMTPAQGWNVFRRIQRRADRLRPSFAREPAFIESRPACRHIESAPEWADSMLADAPAPPPAPATLFDACRAWHSFRRFTASIPPHRRKALADALSRS
jgi:DNA-directed RNA polymerase specialized sigma24 family protein